MRFHAEVPTIMSLPRSAHVYFAKPIEADSTHYPVETDELKRKFQNVQEENLKLQAVITDLTQVNKRWQKYNNDRQLYVQRLLQTIEDQQDELKQINGLVVNLKKNSSENNTSSMSCSSMSCESDVDRLQSVEQKLKERVEVLEFQVKAHRDDWEAELNEKKQALQDKQVAEKRSMELLAELQSLKRLLAAREESKSTQYICHCCGHPCEPETYPSQNRVYRTAVHLPYTVNRNAGSGKTYIFQNDIVFDGAESMKCPESVEASDSSSKPIQQDYFLNINEHNDSNVRDLWEINEPQVNNIDTREVSYSRSSTIPLVSSPIQSCSLSTVTTPNHSETSLNDETIRFNGTQGLPTITSFVQIPISKSLSAPDRKPNKFPTTPRKSFDSIKFSSVSPPVSFINPVGSRACDMLDGIATQTVGDVICPSCRAVFPPKMHLKFLDHFESCQIVKKN